MKKLFRRLRDSRLAAVEVPMGADSLANTCLVMTLLVRDEEALIERNLDFHYAMGVDFVIATDNGSTDSTRERLRRYEREGRLRLLLEPAHTYQQEHWVNAMGRLAIEEHGADIVFHCDADEFWHARSGNLKTELIVHPKADGLCVPVTNVLLCDAAGQETFPEDAVYEVVRPFRSKHLREDSRERSLYLLPYPPDIMMSARAGFMAVKTGNHGLADDEVAVLRDSTDVFVRHYPVQGFDAFQRKAIQGGRAYEEGRPDEPQLGWHWRRWYRAEQRGELRDEYRKLILSAEQAAPLVKAGRVREVEPLPWPRAAREESGEKEAPKVL